MGGIRHWYAHTEALGQATTTVCALQSPAATSTLSNANLYESVSTTTASTVYFSYSTSIATTSTGTFAIGSLAFAANGSGAAMASTTNVVFPPNTWFLASQYGAAGLNVSPTGVCQATWEQLAY